MADFDETGFSGGWNPADVVALDPSDYPPGHPLHGNGSAPTLADLRRLDAESPPPEPDDAEPEPGDRPDISPDAFDFVGEGPADIPPRRPVYGRHLWRGFVSVDVAAGGTGKTAVKVGEALAMAANRPLYGAEIHEGPLRVWLYNLEDPADELKRRVWAAVDHFKLDPATLAGRLFVATGRDKPLCLATETPNGATICRPVVDALIEALQARRVDVLIIDPFVLSHEISENDNRAIAAVTRAWAYIADVCNCAVNLIHHVRKANGHVADVDSARGAKALTDAARSVILYSRMTPDEAALAGVAEDKRGFYFRGQNEKANLAPPSAASWFRMENVDLPNGDSVGVAAPWQWVGPFEGITPGKLRAVQCAIAEGEWKAARKSEDWAGYAVCAVCGLDPEENGARVAAMLKTWIQNGALRVVTKRDEVQRKDRQFIEVGEWVNDD